MRTRNEQAEALRMNGYVSTKSDGVLFHISSYGGPITGPERNTLSEIGSDQQRIVSNEELVAEYETPPPHVLQLCRHPYRVIKHLSESITGLVHDVRMIQVHGVDPKLVKALNAIRDAMETLRTEILGGDQ